MTKRTPEFEQLRGNLELLLTSATPQEVQDEAGLLIDVMESAKSIIDQISRLSLASGEQEAQSALIELMIRIDLARSRLASSYPALQSAMTRLLGEPWTPWISAQSSDHLKD